MASEQSAQSWNTRNALRCAIEAAEAGRWGEAYQLLQQVVAADPSNEVAWFWLAGVTDHPDEALAALNRVRQLNPNHPRLEAARRWAQARQRAAPGHPQGDGLPRSGPAYSSGGMQGAARALEKSLATHSSPSAWSRRLWLGLASLGLVLVICILAWSIWVQADTVEARLTASPTPDNSQRLLALLPDLNAALTESRWEDAIAVLQVMRALDPMNQALKHELAQVYYQLAMRRRDQGDLQGAMLALEESLVSVPDDLSIQKERRLIDAYRQGIEYHQSGDWQGTIRTLALVHLEDPTYLDVTEVLYSAYYNLGLSQQAAGDLVGAQSSYQAALKLLPEEPLARKKSDEVAWLLRPPTPTPTPVPTPIPVPSPTPTPTPDPNQQRIVVDVSEQRMYVYEGGDLLWNWVVSTGEPGRDTAIGQFAVQSKIPLAYAGTWNLDMPYWLGIYWSGPFENGIHALPTKRDTGYKLWDGFLGQRVSYGCVILSDENAETLFNWAKIGAPVTIQP